EPFGDDLRVDALQQHQRRMSVAKIVETDVREPCLREEPRPGGAQRVRTERGPVARIHDGAIALPSGSQALAPGFLICSLPKQIWLKERRQGDCTSAPLGLRLLKDEPGPGRL